MELVGLGLGIDLVLDGHGGCLESMGWSGRTYTTGQRSCSAGAWGAPAAGLGWACRQVQKTWRILIFFIEVCPHGPVCAMTWVDCAGDLQALGLAFILSLNIVSLAHMQGSGYLLCT